MSDDVKNKYRMFRSGKSGHYYWQDTETGKQGTLGTPDKGEAQRILNAKNESCNAPATAINLQIARAYLNAADPGLVTRTWQEAMEALVVLKRGTNRLRWNRAIQDRGFDPNGSIFCTCSLCPQRHSRNLAADRKNRENRDNRKNTKNQSASRLGSERVKPLP